MKKEKEVEKLEKEIAYLNLKLICAKGNITEMTIKDLIKDATGHLTERQIKKIKGYLIPEKEENI